MKKTIFFKKGDEVIKMGDINTACFLVNRGRFEVRRTVNGTIKKVAEIGPDEIFGELSLIDKLPRTATITAMQESSVTVLFKDEEIDSLVRDNPKALLVIVKVLCKRLREIIQKDQSIGH